MRKALWFQTVLQGVDAILHFDQKCVRLRFISLTLVSIVPLLILDAL